MTRVLTDVLLLRLKKRTLLSWITCIILCHLIGSHFFVHLVWLVGVAKWSYNIRNMFFPWPVATLMFQLARFQSQRISFWITLTYLLKTVHIQTLGKNPPIFHLANVSPSDVISHQTRFAGILQLPKKTSCLPVYPEALIIWCAMFREEVPCTCLGDAQHETWSKSGGLIPVLLLGSD